MRSRAVTLGVRRVCRSELEYLVASYILVPWVVVGDTEHTLSVNILSSIPYLSHWYQRVCDPVAGGGDFFFHI